MSLEREIGEIHTKVDNIVKLLEKQNGRLAKVENKVVTLEKWQSLVLGAFATCGAIIGVFTEEVVTAIKKII